MDYTTLIQDYFDGILDDSQESSLFYQVASNEKTRSEFRNFLTIDLAYKKDSIKLIPSARATVNVFSRIGFPGYVNNTIAQNESIPINKFSFIKKYSNSIYSGLISSAITAMVLLLLFNSNGNHSNSSGDKSNNINSNYSNKIYNAQDFHNNKASSSSFKVEQNSRKLHSFKYKEISKNQENKNDENLLSSERINTANKLSENIDFQEIEISKPYLSDLRAENNFRSNLNSDFEKIQLTNSNNFPLNFDDLYGLSIELRGMQDWSLNNPSISESTIPKFNNSGITVLYSLDGNWMIGIDARQEYFYQEFTGVNDFGDQLLYKQFPNLISYGAALRYRIINLENFASFAQIILGGNKAGYIGRGQLGFEYTIDQNFSFVIGGELGIFDYFHSNNHFTSSKIGINYGVRFKF